MSKAKKCDRCEKYYDPYKNEILLAKGSLQDIIDLCPECKEELTDWLSNGGATEKRRRFSITKDYDYTLVCTNPPEMVNTKIVNDMADSLKGIIKAYIITKCELKNDKLRCELNVWL